MFTPASSNSGKEREIRKARGVDSLKYGVSFLDDALGGILKSDLVLLGAPSGIGKTALCCNIAATNLADGKRVSYFALEAEQCEIESRIKYGIISQMFHADYEKPELGKPLRFPAWYSGHYLEKLKKYEDAVEDYFSKAFTNLSMLYKPSTFGLDQFIEAVIECSDKTDLIIVDHVHYFDLDDSDNENKAMKKITKTARTLALENNKPIIMVAHLRKRDRGNEDMVADMDEFHGTSELSKIATRVITFAPGSMTNKGNFETFFRIPKNRIDGGVTRYLGRMIFSPEKGSYEERYRLGMVHQKRGDDFEEVSSGLYPEWSRSGAYGCPDLFTAGNQTVSDVKKSTGRHEDFPKPYREN